MRTNKYTSTIEVQRYYGKPTRRTVFSWSSNPNSCAARFVWVPDGCDVAGTVSGPRVSPISVSSRGRGRTWYPTRWFNERTKQQRQWSFFLNNVTQQTQTNALLRLWGFFPYSPLSTGVKCSAQWTILQR